ncbi:MAG: tRNA (N(6)-L-threonylcarbamoyladenosine(37)-C(2))-methylthiotransferase MtaB [Xylanivirga thermophila]|jgi:threonylcarbamoyladenosine tRNA methylthiotransferase MtaB|uniref:tRNA (N(6)-L-threonylcarbamoyladenosine(37)-C(2))- methylthiotransferase MtaB n=1 Tax=Xylanivirga thermophila TaxID=2496273 RepID=UPI0039F6319C
MGMIQKKKVAFYTLGCKVNQYDTQAMLEQFKKNGYEIVDFDEYADIYVINTCTVTNLGDRKSRQMIRKAHKQNTEAIVVAAGCYAQTAPGEIISIPGVKLVIGNKDRSSIVELVEQAQSSSSPINVVDNIMNTTSFENMQIEKYEQHSRAVLKVQEGCNQFCTYCIIPYARGPIRSRNPEDVYEQVKTLVDNGFKEVVLTGIHIASYGKDLEHTDLLELIEDIHNIDGLLRIRLGSLEPTFLTFEVIQRLSKLPKVCPHYHISLQSGSDKTLKRMKRHYTTGQYAKVVDELRGNIPDVAVTTDIMVGFPGETEEEFKETLDFVDRIAFSKIHVFKYSPRRGTPAANFPDQVPAYLKEDRSRELIYRGSKLEEHYMERFLGKTYDVLFEQQSKDSPAFFEGYTGHYIKVLAPCSENIHGEIRPVLLEQIQDEHILGRIQK